jgi:hypothetical protein
MHTETVSTRFERSVDRTGEHHVWTGAIDWAAQQRTAIIVA